MAPKKKFARVDGASRLRTAALRTVWTSAMLGVGFAAGRVAPADLLERFTAGRHDEGTASVEVAVPAVPREVYTVDNEMERRREQARADAATAGSGAAASAGAPGSASPAGPSVVAAAPADPGAPSAPPDAPAIGVVAGDPGADPAQPRVVTRVASLGSGQEPITSAPIRGEPPPPRPVTLASPGGAAPSPGVDPGSTRVVRRAAPGGEETHPFELEVVGAVSQADAQAGRDRLASAGLDAHVVPSGDGRFRVVIRGRAGVEEQARQRRLAERVLTGEL